MAGVPPARCGAATADSAANPPRRFSSALDHYVGASVPRDGAWPVDEWGDAMLWRAWFARLSEPFGVARWQRAIAASRCCSRTPTA